MLRAYGLVYRLMQRAIPVYWLVNPTKATLALNAARTPSSQSYLRERRRSLGADRGLTRPPTCRVSG